MVKRTKSPDAVDDAKYLVIYKPYPEGADLEVEEDCIALVQWIAACIGPAPLMAIHYKPKSRGMVLVEIDKTYAHYGRILGEHTWSNFIKNLSSDESFKKSQIFFSIYDVGRAAQKEGWKRIHIKSSWFTAPSKSQFVDPYPETTYCDPPPEEPTNKRICRYLPGYIKPPPPKKVAPKPGSDAWVAQKSDPTSVNVNVEPQSNRKGKNKKAQTPVSPVSPNAWNQPILSQQQSSSTPFSSNAVPRAPTVTIIQPPLVPPGLGHPIPASVANRTPWATTPSIARQTSQVNAKSSNGNDGDSSDEGESFFPNMADIKVLSERSIARLAVPEEGGVPYENLWEDHEATQNQNSQRMICTVHKRKCALTCIDFSRQVKAKRREEEAAKGLDQGKQGRNRYRGRSNGEIGRSRSRSERSHDEDNDKSDTGSNDEPESENADAKSAENGWSTFRGRSRGNRNWGRGRGGRGTANMPVVDAPVGRMRGYDDNDG